LHGQAGGRGRARGREGGKEGSRERGGRGHPAWGLVVGHRGRGCDPERGVGREGGRAGGRTGIQNGGVCVIAADSADTTSSRSDKRVAIGGSFGFADPAPGVVVMVLCTTGRKNEEKEDKEGGREEKVMKTVNECG